MVIGVFSNNWLFFFHSAIAKLLNNFCLLNGSEKQKLNRESERPRAQQLCGAEQANVCCTGELLWLGNGVGAFLSITKRSGFAACFSKLAKPQLCVKLLEESIFILFTVCSFPWFFTFKHVKLPFVCTLQCSLLWHGGPSCTLLLSCSSLWLMLICWSPVRYPSTPYQALVSMTKS